MKLLCADQHLALAGRQVAILGYGNQGRAQALNLRDSGVEVVVGQRPGKSFDLAYSDGFSPKSVSEASHADVVMATLPDETAADVFHREVGPHLGKGQTLLFTHGFNIHFGFIIPPETVDVALVAPKGQATAVRSAFLAGSGVPGLVAVHQDVSGRCKETALAYASACGYGRKLVLETTFREETETDLFGEQAVLCGGMIDLMIAGFETLTDAGYAPEMAYFECIHEAKIIIDLLLDRGLCAMRQGISDTAEWGGYLVGPRLVDEQTRLEMRAVLQEIQSGAFAKRWVAEARNGKPELARLKNAAASTELERVADELRSVLNR